MIEPLVVARAINDVGALSLVGALVFRAVVLGPVLALLSGAQGRYVARSIDRLVWASLVLAGIGDLGWLAIQTGEMTGEALPGALSSLPVVIKATHFGRVPALRLGLLLLTGLCELAVHRRRGTVTPVVLGLAASGAAVAAQAWAGHAVAVAGPAGVTLLVSQAVHMLAAGAWVGGLLPLVRLLAATDLGAAASPAARRFSSLGIACVAALAVTAAVNAWFLVGSFPALLGTPYGRDSLIKLGLFLAMLGLAALNRFQFTPRLATGAGAIGRLRRSASAEALLGLAVLIVAAQLASAPPGAHAQPWWPLPRRFSTVALELPGVDLELLAWACGALGGVLLKFCAALNFVVLEEMFFLGGGLLSHGWL